MSGIQWLWMIAALGALVGVAWLDGRFRRNRRRRINEALAHERCSACGAAFAEWRGRRSRNHYTFTDDAPIEDVIEVTCRSCGRETDAFWCADSTLEVQPPW